MKVKNILKQLVVLTFVIFAFACSSSDDGSGSGNGGGGATATSITVSGNASSVFVGEPVTFTVVDNIGANVTSSSELKIAGAVISNPYTFNTVGSYNVTATSGSLTNSTTITVEEVPTPSSITMTTNTNAFWYDTEGATFVVTDNLGNNLTGLATYTAESGTLNNPATFSSAGVYNAYATYTLPDGSTLTSNTVELNAVASTHTTKVMIEDYTGTWCGYCPRVASALEDAVNQNGNIIPVAIHSGDVMEPSFTNQLESTFGVNGWPWAQINRDAAKWNENINQLTSYLNARQNMGLAINSSLSGNTISAEVKVHYDLKVNFQNRIVVYLLENGLVYNQVNYYNGDSSSPWYQTGNPIVGFVHDHVARTVFTDVFGDAIPAANTETGATYTANYSLTVPASVQNTSNLELVAFVVGPDNKALNIQKADLGENKDFD